MVYWSDGLAFCPWELLKYLGHVVVILSLLATIKVGCAGNAHICPLNFSKPCPDPQLSQLAYYQFAIL